VSVVLDASVTLAWLYPDEATAAINEVFEIVMNDGGVVPSLWRLEVANGLTLAVRRGRITAAFRSAALADLALAPISIDPETDLHAWNASLQLADRFRLTVYDAAYLELAHRRSHPLASLDMKLRDAARALGVAMLGV
jgi:predicted nucleic acid-binding protein